MANEDDSSVSEEFEDTLDVEELLNYVKDISTRIQRKKENLQDFVAFMKKENSVNKTVLKRFHSFEDDFKEGRKCKAELNDLQSRLDDRVKEVEEKLGCIETALDYISSKEAQISTVREDISCTSDDEKQQEELLKCKNGIQSLFSEVKIKFRECKKVKLSLLTKFKPDDLIQSVKSWEKAAEVAREINRKVSDLQKELQSKSIVIDKMEEELKQEKENAKEQEQEFLTLAEEIKMEDESKKEQAVLINTFRSLLDESEKLVRNLEAQNSNLNQIILDEKNRVSDLRGKLSDLQKQIENERTSNREMNLKFEHMKAEFQAATSENEGYKRDMQMIRKELDTIKEIKEQVSKKETKSEDEVSSGDSLEELEETLEIKDKLLNEKYFEVEKLKSELEKSSKRVIELENELSSLKEDKEAVDDELQIKEREVEEFTDILSDTQTALESEKLAKDQFVIKCEMLERKNALIELQLQEYDVKDGTNDYENAEQEIRNLREMLKEEKERLAESTSLVEELEEQLKASEELREYEEDIKARSIENIVHAELENRKLIEIVEELRERLSEKDSGIEELIAHCAVEELKLREEVITLTNQLHIYKRDCVYKANIIERLRRQIDSRRGGLGIVDEEEEEEGEETGVLVKAAALERQLHEERLKTMKYEQALLALNKQYEEVDGAIREKDYELSKKSAEDGKRIAELLQELESDKKVIMELEEQIENLEEILSLKEVIERMENDDDAAANLEAELKDMKDDYAAKKLRRKDDLISELKANVESLKIQVDLEQRRLQKQEESIRELDDAKERVGVLEDENSSQKEYIEELSERVTEGQRLISELEGVADRERMRVATIEQLLLQDKHEYSKHLDDVKDLKKKVESYQSNVGELRSKVSRINRNLPAMFSPRDDSKNNPLTISRLQGTISAQKTIIKELAVNMNAVEEKNEEINAELKEQTGKNAEEDEKIEQLLVKSKECEDLVEYMREELELVRKRYQGLSGESSENDNFTLEDKRLVSEDIEETKQESELLANPMFLLPPLIDDEKDHEGDDEHEEGESGETVYFDDENEKQDAQAERQEPEINQTKQRELIHHLLIFEKVFEQIFAEEGKRIEVVLRKFRSVIQKNTELVSILQNLRQTLLEARMENELKENEIKKMKNEIINLELEVKQKENEQKDLNKELEDQITRVNQMQESLSVGELLKAEYEREIENLNNKIVEERESSERLREDVERETNARYEFEVKLREIEDEAYNGANIINELQKDLKTERKCYGIVTERLQDEQKRLDELESQLKEAEESATNDKELVEELRKNLSAEEKQKMELLNKLEKIEKESIEKDEEINHLLNQLGKERSKIEGLFAEIDLEKMTKSKAEAKLQELEEHFNRDELIFEELRGNIDLESAKNREISELLDKERERSFELEEKTKELEKQVLMDLELFDELKTTIEQEREHNRELDALLNEKNSAYNNKDKLLAELDDQLAEIKAALTREQLRNQDLNQELKKRAENEAVVKDLQDMLKSQIIHAGELDQMAQKLKETNDQQNQKIETLESALAKLKGISTQLSKELEEDLEAWGLSLDEADEIDASDVDFNGNVDHSAERNALRLKALLNNELNIKKRLVNKTDGYERQVQENNEIISRLNESIGSYKERTKAAEDALNSEKKQREETEIKLRKADNDLQEERKSVDNFKNELQRLEQMLQDISKEHEKKNLEVEQLTKTVEGRTKEDYDRTVTIQRLEDEKETALKEKKDKEDECELMKTYYEEEHKFAKERLEQNQLLKKQIEELEKAANEKEDTLSNLKEENNNLSLKIEETIATFKTQADVLKEHKDNLKNVDAKEKYIKELEKEIGELSQSHRHKKHTKDKAVEESQSKDIMAHLKEIEEEIDGLETELSQKDEEIKKLTDECIKATNKMEENEKHVSEMQDKIDRYKQLLKQHEAHAQKSANALEKARLLCELLQTDIEIKDLTISQLNSDVHSMKSDLKDNNGQNKGDKVPVTHTVSGAYQEDQDVKKCNDDFDKVLPVICQKDDVLQGGDEQSTRLREQIIHMAKVMEKVKKHNQKVIAEKDKEIEKQEKTIAMIKNLYHSLKTEARREEILSDVQLLLPEKETNDAAVIMNDLEIQLKSMKDEVENRAETVKELKEIIKEIKRDDNEIDRNLLRRKENVHKLLSIQLEEKEKKLKRMEKLLEGLRKIYHERNSKDDVCFGEKSRVQSADLVFAESPGKSDDDASSTKSQDDGEETITASSTEQSRDRKLQEEKETVPENEKNTSERLQHQPKDVDKANKNEAVSKELDLQSILQNTEEPNSTDGIPLVRVATDNSVKTTAKQPSIENQPVEISPIRAKHLASDAKDFPKSGWKAKVLAYVVIAIGLSFLPQYLKASTLRVVLSCVATPLFFILSAIELNVYRKKAENYLKSFGAKAQRTNVDDDEVMLLDEERKLKVESEQKLIQELQEHLKQEIQRKATKEEELEGKDEVDVLEEQKRKISDLEKMLHAFEKAKIEEHEQNKTNFEEYIKLRNAVEELQRKREATDHTTDSSLELSHVRKQSTVVNLEGDLKMFSLRSRSLPLWVALAVGIYQLTALHPAAPCAIIVLFTLYAANSWFKIKSFKNKLLEEREAGLYKSAELEDLTELLEKEHEVVETQKSAMDIMVREIDHEYITRKGKAVTLAKLILQMKELEEMKCALKEEDIEQAKDPDIDATMRNISKDRASERVRLYFEMSRKLPELEEDSLDNFGDIEETVKELATLAETRLKGTRNQVKTQPTPTNQGINVQKLFMAAGVTLSTIAMVTSLVFKSYIPAILMAVQLVTYLLSQRQRKNVKQKETNSEELQVKLDQEVKRNKANRLQIGKLKRLLATEKSLKKTDETAKEIRLRVKERAEKRKMATSS